MSSVMSLRIANTSVYKSREVPPPVYFQRTASNKVPGNTKPWHHQVTTARILLLRAAWALRKRQPTLLLIQILRSCMGQRLDCMIHMTRMYSIVPSIYSERELHGWLRLWTQAPKVPKGEMNTSGSVGDGTQVGRTVKEGVKGLFGKLGGETDSSQKWENGVFFSSIG